MIKVTGMVNHSLIEGVSPSKFILYKWSKAFNTHNVREMVSHSKLTKTTKKWVPRFVVVSRLANGLTYDLHNLGSKDCPETGHNIHLKPQPVTHVYQRTMT